MMDTQIGGLPQRKNPRLRNFDYAQKNTYFVTICTKGKKYLFGSPEKHSVFGQIAYNALNEIPQHFSGVSVDHFVVMPNHIHALLSVTKTGIDLSVVVGQYKSRVTKQVRTITPGVQVWQASFHDHIIRNQADYNRIWNYIDENPIKWVDDCFYCG